MNKFVGVIASEDYEFYYVSIEAKDLYDADLKMEEYMSDYEGNWRKWQVINPNKLDVSIY